MSFKYFITEQEQITESLNTPVAFTKIEKDNNLTFLYFNIEDKEFRIVIEKVDDESAIIFEQKINEAYTYEGMQNNLSVKESLSLFSTLKNIKKYLNNKNYIYTDSKDKLRLYLKILKSIKEVKFINYIENSVPYVIGFSYDENDQPRTSLAIKIFKKWKLK